MTYSYNQVYLNDAMNNMAEAFEIAAHIYKYDLDYFLKIFIISGIASQFEKGNPKYIAGKSGAELVADAVILTNASEVKMPETSFINISEEYWTGWVTAYYQWISGKSFKEIQQIISMSELKNKYNPYHEMDEMQIVDYIQSKADKTNAVNRLQMYRKMLGLSQSELATEADVNLRTLQQYEIGAKDIHKASVSTIASLAKVLKCDIENLL